MKTTITIRMGVKNRLRDIHRRGWKCTRKKMKTTITIRMGVKNRLRDIKGSMTYEQLLTKLLDESEKKGVK